jgi:hypothetical protein
VKHTRIRNTHARTHAHTHTHTHTHVSSNKENAQRGASMKRAWAAGSYAQRRLRVGRSPESQGKAPCIATRPRSSGNMLAYTPSRTLT